jgi:hypothetical protein
LRTPFAKRGGGGLVHCTGEVPAQCKVGDVSSALGSSLQGGGCQFSARWEALVQRKVGGVSSVQGGCVTSAQDGRY